MTTTTEPRKFSPPQSVHLVNHGETEEGPAYLVTWRYDADSAPELELKCASGLAEWLRQEIEHDHYTGDGALSLEIWRWGGEGQLARMTFGLIHQETDAADYMHLHYGLWPLAVPVPERASTDPDLTFTVRIDGRA